MIVDSSAVMAIVNHEPLGEEFLRKIVEEESRMSAVTWVELGVVADARSHTHGQRLDEILDALEIDPVPVSERQAEVARLAYRRFGRGSDSKAQLNFGDCFAYALAVTEGEQLLFAGEDFTHTDVARAL